MPLIPALLKRAIDREENQPKREKCLAVSKAGRAEPCKPFGFWHRAIGFGVFPAGLSFCLGPVFPHYASFSLFWNSDVYSVSLLEVEICLLILWELAAGRLTWLAGIETMGSFEVELNAFCIKVIGLWEPGSGMCWFEWEWPSWVWVPKLIFVPQWVWLFGKDWKV